MIVKET